MKIGIIGGSGFEDPEFLKNTNSKQITTPYGDPSSDLILGSIADYQIVFLSRHGKKHTISPSNVNYQANIWSLKEEGCTHILAVTACPTKPDPNWTAVEPNPSTSSAPWKIYNIGNSNPINLHDFIAHIEKALQKKAILEYCPMQPGDVVATHADVKLFEADFEFKPKIGYREGIERFARWYREYYKIG